MTVARIMEIARDCAGLLKHASYRETAYQAVFGHLLKKEGYDVKLEVGVVYRLPPPDLFVFGHGRLDMLVTNTETGAEFIIELKANVRPNIQQHLGQLARYLEHRQEKAIGILVYFSGWDSDVHHYILDCRK
jgi:hypothetical protein